jgi:acyl-CoA thioester hydrolase
VNEGVYGRTRIVEARDIDGLGHVNNTVWVRYVIELAEAHASAIGFDAKATREAGGIWIVRRHEIDYHASALEGERLLEQTWVSRIRGARSVRHARFSRAADATLLLSSRTEWAFVDPDSQRPRRIPPRVLEAFPETPGPDAD